MKGLLTTREFAHLCSVSVYTVRYWARTGKIPSLKIYRRVYIPGAYVEALIMEALKGEKGGEKNAEPKRGV